MTETYLSLSWGVSRGRDTYGYNIRRLDDQTGGKRYRCMGGGYDMTGTVVADWLTDVHQDRLVKLADRAYARYSKAEGYRTPETRGEKLYGMALDEDSGRVSIDGACGIESVLRIAKAAGLRMESRGRNRGETTGWIVTAEEEGSR